MMSDEERQRTIEDYYYSVQNGIPVTKEMFESFKDASSGVKGLTAAQNKLFGALGKAIADTTKAMYQGKQGAETMADSVETVTDALGTLGLTLMTLGGPLGLLAGALGAGVLALGKFNKVASQQADQLFKTYKDLSSSGQAAAGGMTEIFENMQKFGYGIEQLGDMTALLKENSNALASFGGTAASGTKAFANAANEIQRSDVGKALQMLGKTPDDINKGVALFVKQQQQSGVSSSAINKDLAQQSAAYIKNLDILSKLTGDSADQMQAKLDDAMAEDAFNQTIYELKKKSAAGDAEAGRLATEYENAARQLTGESLKEFQKGVGGDISAMSKSMMVSSEAVSEIGKSSFTAAGYIDKMKTGADRFREGMGGSYKFNALGDVAFSAKELSKIQSRNADETAQQQKDRAKAEQELQEKGLDPTTKAQVELRIQQMNARDSLQSFVQAGVAPATEAMKGLAGATNTAAGMANKAMPGAKAPGGGAAMGGGSTGGGGLARKALDYGGTAIGGAAGALLAGGATAGVGAVAGAVGGAYLGHQVGTAIANFLGVEQPDQDKSGPQIQGAGATGGAQAALAYFQSQGWTKEQAAGIVGNLQAESGPDLNPNAIGDGGQAVGIAQWHPDRQANFQQTMGKPIQQSSLNDQLQFVQWELSNTEMSAGSRLKAAKTAEEAAQIIDRMYERSSGTALNKRIANATALTQQKAEFGGVVKARPGGTNILAGEAGSDEAFVPLAHGKIPVDIKDSAFMKEFVKSLIGNMAPDQQRSGNLAKEQADLLRQLMPEFSRAISLGVSDIKLSQPTVDKPPIDPQAFAKAAAGLLGDLKQPQIDPQAIAKAISGNLGDTKQPPIDTQAIAKAISGSLGDLKQPQMDPQVFAKLISNTMSDFKAVQPAGGELTRNPTPDTKIADSMNNIKLLLDSFVNTKIPSPGEMLKSVMPDFSKVLPVNDMVNAIAEKINQQTAQKEKISTTAPPPAADNSQQLALMNQQLNKLDELVRVMNSQLNVSGKILAYQH